MIFKTHIRGKGGGGISDLHFNHGLPQLHAIGNEFSSKCNFKFWPGAGDKNDGKKVGLIITLFRQGIGP